MRSLSAFAIRLSFAILAAGFVASLVCDAVAQQGSAFPTVATPRPLVTQALNLSQTTVLRGNTHPLARAQYDRGVAPSNLPMRRMQLVLTRSPEQESALRKLIEDQQTKGSANYHKWITPEEFGKQFGPSDSDLQIVTGWLQSQGFQVASIAQGKTAIEFSGTAGQVQRAFHTAIHRYAVKGESHWANASDPAIPSALVPVVKGVLTLHNFPRHSNATFQGQPVRALPRHTPPLPLFTFTQQQTTYYGLGPTDFATIYNVLPLWNAGIDGTGQTIAIVGESNINLSDIEAFRSCSDCPRTIRR